MNRIELASLTSFFIVLNLTINCLLSTAQEMTINQCIDIATKNNLSIKIEEQNVNLADNLLNRSRNQKMPSVNFSTSLGYNFGFAIDPTTNNFSNQSSQYLSGGLDLQLPLYRFGQLKHQYTQAKRQLLSTKTIRDQEIRTISLNIAQAYLDAILRKEQIEISKRNVDLSKKQKSRIEKLVESGALPLADLLNSQAQQSLDEQLIIASENQYRLSILNLKNLMNYEGDVIPILPPSFDEEIKDEYQAIQQEKLISEALDNDLRIRSAQLKNGIQEEQIKINKSALYPSLDLFGNINSRYSSLAQKLDRIDIVEQETDVIIFGQTETIKQNVPLAHFEDASLAYQIRNNRGEVFGIRLNVPIYNKNILRNRVNEAEINAQRSALNTSLVEQQVRYEITLAYQSYQNAMATFNATEKSLAAQEKAYENALASYNYGASNAFEFSQNRALKDNAISNYLQSKYNYIFSILVLDYYLGKPF